MNLLLKISVTVVVMTLLAACSGGSTFELFPDPNNAPTANAGTNQSVIVGTSVTLNGSASQDKDGDALTYSWTMTSKPSSSTAVLSSATAVNPTFTADVAGDYILSLIVSDGKSTSPASTVTVSATASTSNTAPVANAGTNQNVITGTLVTLNGSGTDANGDTLTYSWTITSKPDGSGAALSSATAPKPTFTADVTGAYVFSLVVNDGKVNSPASAVTITATTVNVAPVANAGPDQSVTLGAIIQLDGSSSSDANGDELTYNWSKSSASCGTLSSATIVNPTLTGATVGVCVVSLQVFDKTAGSSTDTVSITVAPETGSITVTW